MAWVEVAAADIASGQPITTTLADAWTNNLLTAFAGTDASAPKLQAAALATGLIGSEIASLGLQDIGSYIYSEYTGVDTTVSFGETKPYTDITSATVGTWRNQGDTKSSAPGLVFLWKRVS